MSAHGSTQATAELRKLAHTLDVEVERLGMIVGLPADDLRTLRQQVGEALFQADRPHFVRVAALSKTVPIAIAAKITEVVLPPLIAARSAELLEPHRAAELVQRLSPRYLADVSACMDAARAPEVVAAIPPERVADVGAELARRGEWIVIGSFVAQVTPEGLAASVARYSGEQLLRIVLVLEDPARIDEIGQLLTAGQLDELVAAAADEQLWVELVHLVEHLAPERRAVLARHYSAAAPDVRVAYEAALSTDVLAALS